jgi:hypothetical protein
MNMFKVTKRSYSKVINSNVLESIKNIFGNENFSLSESVRLHHGSDESLHRFVCYFKL